MGQTKGWVSGCIPVPIRRYSEIWNNVAVKCNAEPLFTRLCEGMQYFTNVGPNICTGVNQVVLFCRISMKDQCAQLHFWFVFAGNRHI